MEKILRVIVDTDILIKAYRGDVVKIKNLKLLKNHYCISVISALELIGGSKNLKQFAFFNKVLKVYSILHIHEAISNRAFQMYKNYILSHKPGLPDCFIAASALENNVLLYTDNKNTTILLKELNSTKKNKK